MRNYLVTLLLITGSIFGSASYGQTVIDQNDPVVNYDANNPPVQPTWGTVGKWVRTPSQNPSWANHYKAYIYNNMPFRVLFPNGFDPNDTLTKYPLAIFFHGRGQRGTIYDNERSLGGAGYKHYQARNNGTFNGFTLIPQNPSGFFASGNFQAIEYLIENDFVPYLNVDINRITVHGLSAGGTGTWNMTLEHPKLIAAALPMSASSISFASRLDTVRQIPFWQSQGGLDGSPTPYTSQQVVDAANLLGMDYKYVVYPHLGHGVWGAHWADSDFFPYMNRANKTNPVVYFGKREFCPGDPITATMAVTAGYTDYEWRKDGVVIAGANTNSYTATQLGTYEVRIKRGNEWSYWSASPVVLQMKAPTVTPPIEIDGIASNVIPSPDNSTGVPLTVTGDFETYSWKLAGTSTVIGTTKVYVASNPGDYVVSVTEKFGCSSNDSPIHTVVDANGSNGPEAAVGPAVFAVSQTSLKVTWSDNPTPSFNETGYEVYRSDVSGGPYQLIGVAGADSVRWLDEGLIANTTYYYVVRAINDNAASATSAEVNGTTYADVTPPSTPGNLRVVRTAISSVTLAWDASTDDAGVDKYEIYNGPYRAVVVPGNETEATVQGLIENQVYNFTVKARDHGGNKSAASNQVTAAATFSGLNYSYYHGNWTTLPDFNALTPVATGVTPNVDIGLRTQNDYFGFMFDGHIDIPVAGNYTFVTRSDDGSKLYIGGYDEANLVVNNDGLHGNRYREGTYNFPTAGKYPITITFFERTGGHNLQVFWKNTAHGIGNTNTPIPDNAFGAPFVMPCCTPSAPYNITATGISYDKVSVAWDDSNTVQTGYQIYRSTDMSSGYVPVGIVSANDSTFEDTIGLLANTTYYYQVVALGQYGASHDAQGYSNSIGFINYGVAARDNATGTGFIMYSEQDVFDRFSASPPYTTNSKHLIAVVNNAGQWQYDNNNVLVDFTPVASDVLIATVDFSADDITSLIGTNSTENGIRKGYASGDLTFNANLWGGGFNNGEFTVGGTYFNTLVEDYDDATTLSLPAIPTAPSNLVAAATSIDSVDLTWTDNSNNEDQFVIYRSFNGNQNFLPIATLPANTTSYKDGGLFANSSYYYFVVVSNPGGGDSTTEASTTTLNTAPVLTTYGDILMRHSSTEDIQLTATDANNDALTYSSSNIPSFGTLTDYGDGTALLRLTPAITDTATYSALVITVTDAFGAVSSDTFDVEVTDNHIPELDPVADFVIDEGDSASVMLNATDLNGAATLSWDISKLPSFASLTDNGDGTALLKFKPLYADGGPYPGVVVAVVDDKSASAESRFDITVNEINPNQTVEVNYRHNVNAASPWNNITSVATTALSNTSGNPSGISTELVTTAWNTYNDGEQTGNNSGVVPDDVLKGYYYFGIFGAPNTVDMKLTGLDPVKDYNLSFVASSKWGGVPNNGSTEYSVNGQSASVNVQNNTSNTANLTGLKSDANGDLTVTMSKTAGTPVGYINGFVLEDIYNYGAAPDAPRNLSAVFDDNAVDLTWYDAPYNETGFDVYRSDAANGTYTKINTQALAANSTSYEDNNVVENNFYYYKVKAVNAAGESNFSEYASVHINNTPPSISISGDSTIAINGTGVLNITAVDPPNNIITLTATNLPAFAAFVDAGNGTGTITCTPSATDAGNHVVTILATDDLGSVSTRDVTLNVSEAILYSVYVNFNQNANAAGAAPWNNTSKAPAINDLFSNLNDNNNSATTIDLELTTAFGGSFNLGAQTGDNSGVVSDAVLKEYYWFGIFGAPDQVQLKVSDLDNTKKYNFKFVGSSTFNGSGITDNGETDYAIGNKTVSVDVQNNTSQMAVISNVVADNNGEVIIDISKGAGASVGYLNAMIIEVIDGDPSAFNPANLTAAAVSGSSIELNWDDNSNDETGFDIERCTTGNEIDFVTVHTTSSNVSSYVDAGLTGGTVYYYRVRGVKPAGHTAYTNMANSGTIEFSVYININGDAVYDEATPWNNLSVNAYDGAVFSGFKNDAGINTGIDMVWNTAMQGSNDWGTTTGNNSGVVPDNVSKSFFFNDAYDAPGDITMTNLSQQYTYNFKFFGAISTGFDIRTNFTIGNETVTNAQTNNTTEMVSINGVVSDLNNEVRITVQEQAGSNWAIFNGMIIEAVTAPVPSAKRKPIVESNNEGSIAVRYGISQPEIKLYPNPLTTNIVNLAYRDASLGDIKVIITDITGNIVVDRTYSNTLIDGSLQIDMNDINLNNGIYLIRTQFADGQVRTGRIVKL